MTRVTQERWLNPRFGIEHEQAQRRDEKGPVVGRDGEPEMVDLTVLVLIRDSPDGQHVLRIPFEVEAREALIAAMQGSQIIVPRPSAIIRPVV